MRKILFFDTETTGVPKDYKASYTDVDNWPRVISLAWMLVDEDGNIIRQSYELVKPDGWVMPTEKFWLDNGYTQETNMEKGLPIEQLLDAFYEAKMEADFLAAHNLN
ncbi:MAG TPA: 3'-5' exonuclease, partial [Spirochaetia bacterium]|nr:3'-5' exonuclease [Spirochaetia bacterium]